MKGISQFKMRNENTFPFKMRNEKSIPFQNALPFDFVDLSIDNAHISFDYALQLKYIYVIKMKSISPFKMRNEKYNAFINAQ